MMTPLPPRAPAFVSSRVSPMRSWPPVSLSELTFSMPARLTAGAAPFV
jgi:hypothetical protein